MSPNPQFPANLVTFAEKILNGKFHFLCSAGECLSLNKNGHQQMKTFIEISQQTHDVISPSIRRLYDQVNHFRKISSIIHLKIQVTFSGPYKEILSIICGKNGKMKMNSHQGLLQCHGEIFQLFNYFQKQVYTKFQRLSYGPQSARLLLGQAKIFEQLFILIQIPWPITTSLFLFNRYETKQRPTCLNQMPSCLNTRPHVLNKRLSAFIKKFLSLFKQASACQGQMPTYQNRRATLSKYCLQQILSQCLVFMFYISFFDFFFLNYQRDSHLFKSRHPPF